MNSFRRSCTVWGLCALLGLLLWNARAVHDAALQALALCARSVLPSLFPFLVVSSLLLSLGLGELLSPFLAGWMEPLYRVRGSGAAALLLGLVGGYPVGAAAAAELYRSSQLTRQETERLLTFCNNSNPVFLMSVLGAGVFRSPRAGLWLWLIHVAAALLTGLLFRGRGPFPHSPRPFVPSAPRPSFPTAFVGAVRSALSAILSICAFVTFFYLLAQPLAALLGPAAAGALELFSLTPLLTPTPGHFVLASAAAGWGGLSVLCQTAALLEPAGLSLRPCLRGKAVQALLSALLALAAAPFVLS